MTAVQPRILVAFALLCATSIPLFAQGKRGQDVSFQALRSQIEARAAEASGSVVGVYLRDLKTGKELAVNADSSFHAASTMKVPVMIQYFRDLDAKRISPKATVLLKNSFASIVDGSPYTLDAGDDSDSSLYAKVGSEVGVRELVDRMITRSSNLATNTVIALVDPRRADSTAHALGARNIRVLRGVEDNKAFAAGKNNTTTPRDLGALLAAIERGSAASKRSSREMLAILEHQEFNEEIPAGLPPGTRVAHKTGWITGTLHDAAIIYPPHGTPFVLVVLTRAIPDEKVARAIIQDIARFTWRTMVPNASPASR